MTRIEVELDPCFSQDVRSKLGNKLANGVPRDVAEAESQMRGIDVCVKCCLGKLRMVVCKIKLDELPIGFFSAHLIVVWQEGTGHRKAIACMHEEAIDKELDVVIFQVCALSNASQTLKDRAC